MQVKDEAYFLANRLDTKMTSNQVLSAAAGLGPLPPVIRYFDEYEEEIRALDPAASKWSIRANGVVWNLNFAEFSTGVSLILKHFSMARLHKNAVTGRSYILNLISNTNITENIILLACSSPQSAIEYLRTDIRTLTNVRDLSGLFPALKSLLYFFCDSSFSGWNTGFFHILRTIRSPVKKSKHRTVRDGSAILSFEEERKIIEHFDDLNDRILRGYAEDFSTEELRDACVLFWNYAHGMRPIQIANRNISHVRLRNNPDRHPIIHVTFRYAKQRSTAKFMEQTRKMKRDWTPMMDAWLKRRGELDPGSEFDRPMSLFGLSPQRVTDSIAASTEQITGIRRLPYDLRHSAAQRKADAGCSRLELAEFLMHHDIDTANFYIDMSPTQAEKINQALGLSPLFQSIDKALKSRSVDVGELLRMPTDNQIGAAPHGHLIAGIGGCALGQSLCTKTPALACYECPKFMYLRDIKVHRAARDAVREIVQEFIAAGRTDRASPAFLQLRQTVEVIEAIIDDLERNSKAEPAQ